MPGPLVTELILIMYPLYLQTCNSHVAVQGCKITFSFQKDKLVDWIGYYFDGFKVLYIIFYLL